MSFPENLKRIRKNRQLSQEVLAEMLGVSRQSISKWEQGICMPEAQMLLRLSEKLEVSLDTLVSDSAEPFEIEDAEDGLENKSDNETRSRIQKRSKSKQIKAILWGCIVALCVVTAAIVAAHFGGAAAKHQFPFPDQISGAQSEENTAVGRQAADASGENAVFTTKKDRDTLYELSAEFACAYFERNTDAISSFLSTDFEGSPKEVCPWEGVESFLVKGVDAISTERTNGIKVISIEFRNPDYPDSFLYVTVEFMKQNEEWKIHSYYLEA